MSQAQCGKDQKLRKRTRLKQDPVQTPNTNHISERCENIQSPETACKGDQRREQVMDHLICCSLIEGRSCEKFQILGHALKSVDDTLADLYTGLVESEGNHYADFWLMACEINDPDAHQRLDYFLDLDASLIEQEHDIPLLH